MTELPPEDPRRSRFGMPREIGLPEVLELTERRLAEMSVEVDQHAKSQLTAKAAGAKREVLELNYEEALLEARRERNNYLFLGFMILSLIAYAGYSAQGLLFTSVTIMLLVIVGGLAGIWSLVLAFQTYRQSMLIARRTMALAKRTELERQVAAAEAEKLSESLLRQAEALQLPFPGDQRPWHLQDRPRQEWEDRGE